MLTSRLLSIVLFVFASQYLTAQYYPPAGKWDSKDPEEAGFDANLLNEAVEFAKANEYSGSRDLRIAILEGFKREPYHSILGPTRKRGGPAGVIIKDGYVMTSWGDVDRVDMTFSVTKSYLSTIVGLAVDDHLIKGTDDNVGEYVWDNTFDGEHNSSITWSHLLTQSSDWSGSIFGLHDWADRPPTDGDLDDWRFRSLNKPGTVFEYNDVRVNVLSYSILQVHRKSLPSILKSRIMDPIGASPTWRWFGYNNSWVEVDGYKIQSVSGGGHSGGGVFINTLDHARFGLLFARDGKWSNKQLISQSWIEEATTPSNANPSYGYMWWLNKGSRKWEGVPEHVFYAAGFGGNFIVVDQERDMVIVTRWLEPSRIGEFVAKVYSSLH